VGNQLDGHVLGQELSERLAVGGEGGEVVPALPALVRNPG
jgi:hypothetical protein